MGQIENDFLINSHVYTVRYYLVTRKSSKRYGTRYNHRGNKLLDIIFNIKYIIDTNY